jgi:hypothetical protein
MSALRTEKSSCVSVVGASFLPLLLILLNRAPNESTKRANSCLELSIKCFSADFSIKLGSTLNSDLKVDANLPSLRETTVPNSSRIKGGRKVKFADMNYENSNHLLPLAS